MRSRSDGVPGPLTAQAIYVVRHGQSTWNAERRWAGQSDPPLTELGRAQARAAVERLRELHFDSVASSGLVRAIETAAIIASELGLPVLEPLRSLDERHAGPLSGATSPEIEARWPGFLEAWRSGRPVDIPGGEPWQTFAERVLGGIAQLRARRGRILVVSHMGVQRVIEHRLGRPPCRYDNLEGLWLGASD